MQQSVQSAVFGHCQQDAESHAHLHPEKGMRRIVVVDDASANCICLDIVTRLEGNVAKVHQKQEL